MPLETKTSTPYEWRWVCRKCGWATAWKIGLARNGGSAASQFHKKQGCGPQANHVGPTFAPSLGVGHRNFTGMKPRSDKGIEVERLPPLDWAKAQTTKVCGACKVMPRQDCPFCGPNAPQPIEVCGACKVMPRQDCPFCGPNAPQPIKEAP